MLGLVGQYTITMKAGGNIAPFRFVAIEGTGVDNQVVQAGILDKQCVGVSAGESTAFDAAQNALTGEEVRIQVGDVIRLESGGTIDAGDLIAPDTVGRGIPALEISDLRYAYARALEDALIGEICDVAWIGQVNVNTSTT